LKPDQALHKLALLYQLKNSLYGDSYKQAGKILAAIFDDGIEIESEKDFNRFCIYVHIITKLLRYSNNFFKEPDPDHMKDIAVYATMLLELDEEEKECQ